ncbi:MAG: hypothetical protein GXO19_03755 [Epsilonproteobacteria bacterium]|nr:hypothetical protein [Campylobacterota bacterium]NPA56835.1 hypothetical protein [Campylobacterota bacterium]
MIRLNPGRCLPYISRASTCRSCQEICSPKALTVEEGGVQLSPDLCTDCGACMGVCPTEALTLPSLNPIEFALSFLQSEKGTISCRENFSCLAGLHPEYLVIFGLVKEVTLDLGHCRECPIAPLSLPQIERSRAEASYVLEALDRPPIRGEELALEPKEERRREFFRLFTPGGIGEVKGEIEREIEAERGKIPLDQRALEEMKRREVPDRRKLLFSLLQRVPKPREYRYLENEHLSFISDKEIDGSCDNCSLCYRICPTQALSTDGRESKILLEPMVCIRCHLCHDICEKGSISVADYFDTQEFFEPSQKVLISFQMSRCEDCGKWFTPSRGETLCARCGAEEEGARELWGLL